ncbi:MAG: hypothetical protein HKO99_14085 [Xanthomonadales bacterium]|nr:hypothetical protein [Gammaproteobacteria bacterium]NNK52719.1 hypothetical protein [Xanthomonadales bacterium]
MFKPTSVLIALSSFLFISASYAQSPQICPGNLTLSTQAEVDAFKCREVGGSLTISGEDIVDLGPLARLRTIGRYLSISDNTALNSVVDAFPSLTTVGWGISVYYNPNLVTFSGFDALPATGDNIDFWFNDSLARVLGFGSLQTAGWSLEFGGNPNLVSIPGFESLQTISSSLFVLDNRSLPSITGFNALQYVDWSFDIVGNSSLDSVCGFNDYFTLSEGTYTGGGSFNISENGSGLTDPTTIQDILDAGPCPPTVSPDGILGPWGVPDGLLHVYGTGPSESAAQDFPVPSRLKVTSVWIRAARTGAPTDFYYVTLRRELDGEVLGRSVNVDVSGVISEDEIFASGEWVEFALPTPVTLRKGDYFVQMERTGPGDQSNYINWFTDWENPLPDHAGWVRNDEGEWIMYDEILSDEFLIMVDYIK